jgi:plasmid stabilization system protein ParE
VTVSLHRSAELDLLEAARFYRREGGSRLASRFLDEFHRVVNLLVDFPGLGTPVDGVRRIHPLHDFPYSVIFREDGRGIRVLVVRSQHRDPSFGDSRL